MSRQLPEILIPTPEEDEAINAGIAADPDTCEADDHWFAAAVTSEKAAPHILARYRRTRMMAARSER